MANKRIKDLSTTAAVTASDDFIAVDGATNGTRKLDAYSPTFGGNLTVSGTATIGSSADVKLARGPSGSGNLAVTAATDGYCEITARGAAGNLRIFSAYTGGNFNWYWGADASAQTGSNAGSNFVLVAGSDTGGSLGSYLTVNRATAATTLAGNLTVSGTGTSSFASGSKLGVGTTSPGVTFVAVGAPATLNYTIGSTSLADIRSTSAAATNAGPSLTFSGYYQTSVNTSTYGAIKGILQGAGDGNSAAGALTFLTANGAGSLSEWARLTNLGNLLLGTTTDGGQKLQVSGTAAISGALSIGNTVQTAVSVASTHKVTISIGGSTYYLLATNV